MKYTKYHEFYTALIDSNESILWAIRYDNDMGESILKDFHSRWLSNESLTYPSIMTNFTAALASPLTPFSPVPRTSDEGEEWDAYVTQALNYLSNAVMDKFLANLTRPDARALQRLLAVSITTGFELYPGLNLAHTNWYDLWASQHPDEEPLPIDPNCVEEE